MGHRPVEQRVSLITLACRDVQASRAFYERLGWNAGFHHDDVAFFQLPGIIFGLYSRAALARDVGRPEDLLRPGGMALAFNVRHKAEVATVLEDAIDAGGALVVAAGDTPWGGHSGYFADPDGHLWEVAWNPAWAIGDDGITRMG